MKITDVSYERLDLKLTDPYTIAYETVHSTVNFILKIETNTHIVGYGCAAPDEEVTLESTAEVEGNIQRIIIPFLKGKNPLNVTRLIEELAILLHKKSSSLAMVDMALLDISAKKMEVPLFQFLGGYRKSIATSITIGILPLDETLKKASEFVQQGFRVLKLKGGLQVDEDIEKVNKLFEAHPEIRLRFDANQGYDLMEAIKFFTETKHVSIEIFEQPSIVDKDPLMGQISKAVGLPVMADESIKSLDNVYELARKEYIDMVNIKLMKVGGIREGMHINSVARAAGLQVMVGCLDECGLGIAAGLHFALSRQNIAFADLDGHLDLIQDPFSGLIEIRDGIMYPGSKNGLGI